MLGRVAESPHRCWASFLLTKSTSEPMFLFREHQKPQVTHASPTPSSPQSASSFQSALWLPTLITFPLSPIRRHGALFQVLGIKRRTSHRKQTTLYWATSPAPQCILKVYLFNVHWGSACMYVCVSPSDPRTGITDGCKCHVGTGNWTPVLWKSSQLRTPWVISHFLKPSHIDFFKPEFPLHRVYTAWSNHVQIVPPSKT